MCDFLFSSYVAVTLFLHTKEKKIRMFNMKILEKDQESDQVDAERNKQLKLPTINGNT